MDGYFPSYGVNSSVFPQPWRVSENTRQVVLYHRVSSVKILTEVKCEPRWLQVMFSEHLRIARLFTGMNWSLIANTKLLTFDRLEEKWTNIAEKLRSRKAHPLSDNFKDNTHGLITIYVFLEPWGPGRIVRTSSFIYKINTNAWGAKDASQECMVFLCCFLHQLITLSVWIQLKPI